VDLLFERFVSTERDEPPDIDVDFEHERREEVMQYLYAKYGRHRCALTATVTTYRAKGAIREVAKVFGLSDDVIQRLNGMNWGWSDTGVTPDRLRQNGFDPDDVTLNQVMTVVSVLMGFPRHLGQHVGGFVITRDRLDLLREADAIVMDGLERHGVYESIWQCPTVLVPMAVDGRGREFVIVRPIHSERAMTATPASLPAALLEELRTQILALPGVSGLALDITTKPPGTIEWE
ncbi:MAG: hypothetical protein Q7V01_03680, partial [Vicinamibacterales bacterium]|nr:hypothetical protein [Vicinamibacterales bacterium]